MKKHKLSDLVLDYDLYPRGGVDDHHVGELVMAIEAGVTLPPIVIEASSKRIVDGFHRWKANRRLFGESHAVECIEKSYKNDADLFVDAMRYNAGHGRALTAHDKTRCIMLAEQLAIEADVVASALSITAERIKGLQASRIGKVGPTSIPLKQTIRHMAGRELTNKQAEANDKLSGMNQLFYVNQLVTLIENDLIDSGNAELMEGLRDLHRLLAKVVKEKAA